MTALKTRITVRIQPRLLTRLDDLLKQLRLRRDAYLNDTLGDEVDELDKIPANSARTQRYLRQLRGSIPDKTRLAITLDTVLVNRINAVCKGKGVVRDAFIESYIDFLVRGDVEHGSCVSPLAKAAAILSCPRRDYNFAHLAYGEHHLSDADLAQVGKPTNFDEYFEEQRNEHPAR